MQDAEILIAAIHRDWGEAQGNYDEFRLFTGMRPSEEIALVLADVDLANGIVSVNKARVAGIDRDRTKTGDDRRIALCPRALVVLKRQLALHARLEVTGVLRHDHVFFRETGEPFRKASGGDTNPSAGFTASLAQFALGFLEESLSAFLHAALNYPLAARILVGAPPHPHRNPEGKRKITIWALTCDGICAPT